MKPLRIPLDEILLATNHFRVKSIGEGGFGKVYQAKLSCFPDHGNVAIKRLNAKASHGERVFHGEIKLHSRIDHPNIISLLGFCNESSEMILVYDLASNGSLDKYLVSTVGLTWVCRLQICLGAARGLEYLHNGVGDQERIIHRDITSSNILIDHNWQAKIADFGLSKAAPRNHPISHLVSKNVAGTPGYVDPQYQETGVLEKESDVYSFGVVLLEVFCGELTNDPIRVHDQLLASIAREWSRLGRLHEIVDPNLKERITEYYSISNDGINKKSLDAFSTIIDRCLTVKQAERPSMAQVVRELDQALRLQVNGLEDIRVPLADIQRATNNFDEANLIEPEGFYKMYKGVVPNYKGCITASIVRYHPSFCKSKMSRETFLSEVELRHCSHENILSVLGFCDEEDEKIIIYEYASRGDVKTYLETADNNMLGLTWVQKLKICIGAAQGLDYLHNEYEIIHRDIKSSKIRLNENWDAKISGFALKIDVKKDNLFFTQIAGTVQYVDPHYVATNVLTQKADVYALGIVLFEILCGKLAYFLYNGKSLRKCVVESYERNCIEKIIDPNIMKRLGPDSLKTFTMIAYQCLQYHPRKRPTIRFVVQELEKALIFQEDYEWEPKLPKAYKEIMKMAECPVVYSNIKELYYLLYSGILLKNGNWFSLSEQGENCEMVPATIFSRPSHRNAKRIALRKSRFPKVAKILDLSNINLQVNIETAFLSPMITYTAFLVFKFCDKKKRTTKRIYVELVYKFGIQTDPSVAYFAEWEDNGWMKINLGHVTMQKANVDFKVLLLSMSRYYSGSGGIYIEGIEFLPIENEQEVMDKSIEDKYYVSGSNMDWQQILPTDYQGIIKRCQTPALHTGNNDLYFLLSTGILIDNGEKFFFLSKLDGKKCHMLPARKVLSDSSDRKRFNWICLPQSRFEECVELVSYHEFCLGCHIETEMLSQDTVYACYLVYKISEKCQRRLQCPVKAKNLLPTKKKTEETTRYVYLRSPSPVNKLRGIMHPVQRKDGWMEVIVWEFNSKVARNRDDLPLHIKLICLEGNMSGLTLCGVEFRPK